MRGCHQGGESTRAEEESEYVPLFVSFSKPCRRVDWLLERLSLLWATIAIELSVAFTLCRRGLDVCWRQMLPAMEDGEALSAPDLVRHDISP